MADALLGGIVINEVLVDPNGANNFDTDGNGTAATPDEFFELYNSSAVAIDISGLELWDLGQDNWFTFPPGTILEPGAFAVVVVGVQSGGSLPPVTGDNLAFDAGRGSGVMNNGGDNLVVYDPTNDEYIQATYNGDSLDDVLTASGYDGFSATAVRVGAGEDFGYDNDGLSIQRVPDGSDTFSNNSAPTPGGVTLCFGTGTMISTPNGDVGIETLRVGDLVKTYSNNVQPLKWIFMRKVRLVSQNMLPVRIDVGALGNGVPTTTLLVSQQHRVLVRGRVPARMFGDPEVLLPAKLLTDLAGISIAQDLESINYYHLMFDQHEVLFANGAPAESLYLGAQTKEILSEEALVELNELFPDLLSDIAERPAPKAKVFAKGSRGRQLVKRLRNNHKFPLEEPRV